MTCSILWLRRDLRLHDHVPLSLALASPHPVQPIFIFDTDILAQFSNPKDRRVTFIARTLLRLDAQLKQRGGKLVVLHGRPQEILPALAKALHAEAIFSAEDFEPATIARDKAVKAALPATTRFVQAVDHLIHAPYSVLKDDGSPFKVFTPYYKKWRAALSPADKGEAMVVDTGRYADSNLTALQAAGLNLVPMDDIVQMLAAIGYAYVPDNLWTVEDAPARLQEFMQGALGNYTVGRDLMAARGTSRISPYLRFGLISVRECLRAAEKTGVGEKWISELAWREFYAAVLYHWPEVVTQEFQPQYRGTLPWQGAGAAWDAFTQGKTGYPIVDAAVRELLQTGWMHNRARMIVASFLTKDLMIDWRLGESFFAQYLMDYELASNNGGWQWAASTGTDAAPYFRVFNPVLQSKKFDGAGEYIRRYVPELCELSDKDIHAPWELGMMKPPSYPNPIVDHQVAKARVLAAFKEAGLQKTA